MRSRRAELMRTAVAAPRPTAGSTRPEDDGHPPVDVAERGVDDGAGHGEHRGHGERAGQRGLDRQLEHREVERDEEEPAGVGKQPGQESDRRGDGDDSWPALPRDRRRCCRRPRAWCLGRIRTPMAATMTSVNLTSNVPPAIQWRGPALRGASPGCRRPGSSGSQGVRQPEVTVAAVGDQGAGDGRRQRRGDGDDRRHADGGEERCGDGGAALAEHPAEVADERHR